MPAAERLAHQEPTHRAMTRRPTMRLRARFGCRWHGPLIRPFLAVVIMSRLVLQAAAQDLDDLEFLIGHWRGEAFGGIVEEIWLPAQGDVMHGVFRALSDGAISFSEFIQVTFEDDGVIMRFAHFRPDYSTWEGDSPPMTLRLAGAGTSSAVFEGVDEASPERITYSIDSSGALIVEVAGLTTPLRFVRVE